MDRETRMRRIWETIQDIPRGSVANYGQVAEIAGIPRGARQVGYALRHSPKDLALPWHRVITSSGKSAFDPDSRAYRTQRDRLAGEGGPKKVVKEILDSLDRDTVLSDARREIQARLGLSRS